MSGRYATWALAAAVLLSLSGTAGAQSISWSLVGGNATCTATGACACPTAPQMTCTGATCTLSGDVTCDTGTAGDITVGAGVTLAVTPWSSAATSQGQLNLHALHGTITVAAGAVIDANAAGYTGTAGAACGGGGTPACVCSATTTCQDGNGCGPGFGVGGQCVLDGAGGGGYGGFGGPGSRDNACTTIDAAGGDPYDPSPNTVTLGSGGGAAGSADRDNGGTGPSGGGAIQLFAQNIVLNGTIQAKGGNGAVVNNDAQGGGGGGGILLNASAALSCNSGNSLDVRGGNGAVIDDAGGAGGGGRVKIFSVVISGTCNFLTAAGASGCPGGSGTAAVVTNGLLASPVIVSPPTGSTVQPTPTVSGTLDASVCALGAPVVRLMVDGVYEGTTAAVNCTTNPGTWSFTIPAALAAGNHTIQGYAEISINSSVMQSPGGNTVTVTVPTSGVTRPTVKITSPVAGLYTNAALATITGTETLATAGHVNVSATDSAGNVTNFPQVTANAAGNWTVNSAYTPAAQGAVTLVATATNGAGSAQDTVVYIYDTGAPSLSVNATPTVGTTSFTFSGNYSDATSGIKPGTLTVQVCNSDCSTGCQTVTVTGGASSYSATASSSPPIPAVDGTYCAKATVQDLAGNTATATTTFSVDTTAPTVTINGGPTLDQSNGTVSGTEVDANPGPVTVTYCSDSCASLAGGPCPSGDIVAQVTSAPAGVNWTANPPAIGDGSYCVIASATDTAGNTGSTTATLTVDTSAPSVTVDPNIGASKTPTTVCIAASDANGIASVTATYSVDGASQGSLTVTQQACTQTNGQPGQYTVTVPAQTGDHSVTVTATATDGAGNSAQSTGGFESIDQGPVLVLTTPSDPTNAAAPILQGSATSPIAITNATLTIFSGSSCSGTPLATDDVTSSAAGFSAAPWPTTPVPAGTYCVELTATDALGNVSTTTLVLTVDPSVPDDHRDRLAGSVDGSAAHRHRHRLQRRRLGGRDLRARPDRRHVRHGRVQRHRDRERRHLQLPVAHRAGARRGMRAVLRERHRPGRFGPHGHRVRPLHPLQHGDLQQLADVGDGERRRLGRRERQRPGAEQREQRGRHHHQHRRQRQLHAQRRRHRERERERQRLVHRRGHRPRGRHVLCHRGCAVGLEHHRQRRHARDHRGHHHLDERQQRLDVDDHLQLDQRLGLHRHHRDHGHGDHGQLGQRIRFDRHQRVRQRIRIHRRQCIGQRIGLDQRLRQRIRIHRRQRVRQRLRFDQRLRQRIRIHRRQRVGQRLRFDQRLRQQLGLDWRQQLRQQLGFDGHQQLGQQLRLDRRQQQQLGLDRRQQLREQLGFDGCHRQRLERLHRRLGGRLERRRVGGRRQRHLGHERVQPGHPRGRRLQLRHRPGAGRHGDLRPRPRGTGGAPATSLNGGSRLRRIAPA